jgi:hypothetical protein
MIDGVENIGFPLGGGWGSSASRHCD